MREAIEQYYRENYGKLVKSVANRVGGMYNAEDVVQEAFFRALKYSDTYDHEVSELQTWFGNILKRAMYSFKRDELQQGMVRDGLDTEEPVEDFRALGVSTLKEVAEEISQKKESHRVVLDLAYIKGYRPREIVEIVDEGIRNIYTILDRFKQEMVDKYEHSGTKVSR